MSQKNSLGLTLDTTRRWADYRVLRVNFLNGNDYLKDQVWRFARTWEAYADLDLVRSTADNAEIRVAFQWKGDKGSWSAIGTDSLNIKDGQPTMNFGWFNDQTSSEEFMRTTLHEFGHALGFKHEHQNPKAGIPWDKPAVYKHFEQTQGWSKKKVDDNILTPLATTQINSTRFDPDSIMLYTIPNSLTIGDFETKTNTSLSELDKTFAASIYPWRPKSIISIRNPLQRAVKFEYKWSSDSEWRDTTIAANGRAMYWRSPKEGTFPKFEFRIRGGATQHVANRLNPSAWRDRNYPHFEDGRPYHLVSGENGIYLKAD